MGKLSQITLEKVENGWEIEASYRVENKEDWNTEEKKFIYNTLDDALICIKQIAETV
jgi:hypothetical protein